MPGWAAYSLPKLHIRQVGRYGNDVGGFRGRASFWSLYGVCRIGVEVTARRLLAVLILLDGQD